MRTTALVLAGLALALVTATPARALGPVDIEVTALYWLSDTDAGGESESSDAPGLRAELWFRRLGVSAHYYDLEPDRLFGGESLASTALDVRYKVISVAENSFLAVGAGYGELDFSGSGNGSASGTRLVAEGRVGFVGILYGYARATYMPDLGDWDVAGQTLTDGDAREWEAGLMIQPFPFLELFGGYRDVEASFDLAGEGFDLSTSGAVVGVGVRF